MSKATKRKGKSELFQGKSLNPVSNRIIAESTVSPIRVSTLDACEMSHLPAFKASSTLSLSKDILGSIESYSKAGSVESTDPVIVGQSLGMSFSVLSPQRLVTAAWYFGKSWK